MTTEWRDLPTMADVAAAQAAGEEIEVGHKFDDLIYWRSWGGLEWTKCWKYHSRPRKQTKTIVLRRALITQDGHYTVAAASDLDYSAFANFVMWLPGEEIVEVPV
jgi:hypothetical protein